MTMTRPPITYPVTLADLITIADGAAELDGMRSFLIDSPDEQDRISRIVEQMHSMVERAAAHDAALIYGDDDTCTETN